MAFPWVFESQFQSGSNADWVGETDTVAQLDFPSYKVLARYPWPTCAPYNGAYCARVVLSGGTADAFVNSTTIAIADTVTRYFRLCVWFSPTFTATADDTFAIFELQGAASAVTVSFGAKVTAATNAIQFGIGAAASGAVPATFMADPIQRGVWYTIELKVDCETNATGTVDMYVTRDGTPAQLTADASLTGKTNIAITAGILGIQDHLGTTTGVMLLANVVEDDTRVYPSGRYPNDPVLTLSGHAFVGPGYIAGAAILKGTSPVMTLFDTDAADTTSSQSYTDYFDSSNQTSIGGHIFFQNGCYVLLSGTNPVGQVMLVRSDINPGVFGPRHYSDSGVRRWGLSK